MQSTKPPAIELLGSRWREVTAGFAATDGVKDEMLAELGAAYDGPGRHYHDARHIEAMLDLSERYRDQLADPIAVDLAILFHDAVSSALRKDNEEQSALLAERQLTRLGASPESTATVGGYIRATRHGSIPDEDRTGDLAWLLDFDLAILAASPAEYSVYAATIRTEYSIYPDALYRPGRAMVLEQFLASKRIYGTETLHALWNARARRNLAAELADIEG